MEEPLLSLSLSSLFCCQVSCGRGGRKEEGMEQNPWSLVVASVGDAVFHLSNLNFNIFFRQIILSVLGPNDQEKKN